MLILSDELVILGQKEAQSPKKAVGIPMMPIVTTNEDQVSSCNLFAIALQVSNPLQNPHFAALIRIFLEIWNDLLNDLANSNKFIVSVYSVVNLIALWIYSNNWFHQGFIFENIIYAFKEESIIP